MPLPLYIDIGFFLKDNKAADRLVFYISFSYVLGLIEKDVQIINYFFFLL